MRLPPGSLVASGVLRSGPTWVWTSGLWPQSSRRCLLSPWAAVGDAGGTGGSGSVRCSGSSGQWCLAEGAGPGWRQECSWRIIAPADCVRSGRWRLCHL